MESTVMKGTKTQEDQWMLNHKVYTIYSQFDSLPPNAKAAHLELQRDNHMEYLTNSLKHLPPSFSVLDANRPWLCYWILHSIALLGDSVDEELENNTIDFLKRCQDPDGGYGGGPGQLPHLATTYAAVNSLITLGGQRSLSSIDRGKVHSFLLRMKDTSGGFRMHDGGELDVRACYTAISVASVLNILDDKLVENLGNYIASCQTYEGGIAGEPGSEAHGGYAFCGLAAMILIDEVHRLDLPRLIDWLVFRQGWEGGFQGRTNKLVDGCYSFWQGAVAVMIQKLDSVIAKQLGLPNAVYCGRNSGGETDSAPTSDLSDVEECAEGTSDLVEGKDTASPPANLAAIGYNFISKRTETGPLFNSMLLQQYLLLCSQDPAYIITVSKKDMDMVIRIVGLDAFLRSMRRGLVAKKEEEEQGFRDKPGKRRDHYHTCYCLSGLSISQYCRSVDTHSPPLCRDVLGSYDNVLEQVHPLYGIVLDRYLEAFEFFSKF